MCRAGHVHVHVPMSMCVLLKLFYCTSRCVCVCVDGYPEGFRSVVVRHSMLATRVARASASQRGLSAQGPPLAPGPGAATGVTDASSIPRPTFRPAARREAVVEPLVSDTTRFEENIEYACRQARALGRGPFLTTLDGFASHLVVRTRWSVRQRSDTARAAATDVGHPCCSTVGSLRPSSDSCCRTGLGGCF